MCKYGEPNGKLEAFVALSPFTVICPVVICAPDRFAVRCDNFIIMQYEIQ